jgi:hypothetical protein
VNLEISVDTTRLTVREVLLGVVQQLHEEHEISLRDIVAEMLVVSSMVVSEEDCDIKDAINYSIGFGEDESSDEDDNTEATDDWDRDWKLREQFEKSEAAKLVQALKEETDRLERLNRHEQAIKVKQSLIEKLPEHAATWVSIIGNSDEYYSDFTYVAEQMMRAYVIMQDHDGMETLMDIANKLHSILGQEKFDIEVFEQDFERFYKDISTFESIYDFINENQNFQQKNLFKTLSIDGRKATYMLDWADKLKKISRVRYKDTWLLTSN